MSESCTEMCPFQDIPTNYLLIPKNTLPKIWNQLKKKTKKNKHTKTKRPKTGNAAERDIIIKKNLLRIIVSINPPEISTTILNTFHSDNPNKLINM